MSLLGERLRQAREAHGIAPLQVEIDTRIRASVIEALEQGNLDELPPEPFLRGLIRVYSTYLGLDPEEMLHFYAVDLTPPPPPPPVQQTPAIKPPGAPAPTSVLPASPPPTLSESASPRKKIAPPPLMPKPSEPPETLPSSETPAPSNEAEPGRLSLAHFTRLAVPLPVIGLIGIAALMLCVVAGWLASSQIASIANAQPTRTVTRIPPTRTPTVPPGAQPTNIPVLAATAPPFPTFSGNPTPALKVTPRRTLETSAGLNFDVDVTQTITIQVVADGANVFSGQMSPGTSRSFSATDTLYVRVENPKGAVLTLNGSSKWFAARNFAETRVIERQWSLNDKGTPVSETPSAPAASTPVATPTSAIPVLLSPTPTNVIPSLPSPTPTLTPFS